MKYRIPIVAVVDFGEGVALTDKEHSIKQIVADLLDVLDCNAGELACDLSNADGVTSDRRWNVDLEFDADE